MAVVLRLLISSAAVLAVAHYAEGTMGCANFGHSCYGGYGKRSDSLTNTYEQVFHDVPKDDSAMGTVMNGRFSPDRSNAVIELTKQQCQSLSRLLKDWIQGHEDDQAILLPMYHFVKDTQA